MSKILQNAVDNFIDHMQGRDVPACFTEKEFRSWLVHESEIKTQPLRGFICRDCSVVYADQMRKEGRCFQKGIMIEKVFD